MAEKRQLTQAFVTKLEPPESGRRWVYDAKVPGLAVCITATGSTAWYVYRRVNGKPEKIRLGGFPELSVDSARDRAEEINGEIARGQNPAAAKRKHRGELTLGALWELYLEFHAVPHKKEASLVSDRGNWSRYLESWKSRKLSDIEQRDVQAHHAKIGRENGKYAANRMLALLSKMFNVATDHGEWNRPNPTRGVKQFAEKSRDRFLQPEELPRFLKSLDAEPSRDCAEAFRLMLLTGARKSNVLAMRWADVTLREDAGTWRIPDTKNNEPQLVHLPADAVAVLERRKTTATGEYVFSASRAGTKLPHLVDVVKAWKRVCERADLDHLRMHDLRRTLGSWQAAAGASLHVVGKSLGHRTSAATAIYARLTLDPVRESVDKAVAAMMATVKASEAAAPEGGEQ